MIQAVEPLLRRRVFQSEEEAVKEMTKDYVLHHVDELRRDVARFEKKYGMSFGQFNSYVAERARLLSGTELSAKERQSLGKKIMQEEDDCLDWKAARDMMMSWLGLQQEAVV